MYSIPAIHLHILINLLHGQNEWDFYTVQVMGAKHFRDALQTVFVKTIKEMLHDNSLKKI